MGKIRFLLALSVVIVHCGKICGWSMLDGETAVQTFFIISGFYMSLILNEKYIGEKDSYLLFITNRFLRLAPIYWVVLALTILLCTAVGLSTGDWIVFANYSQTRFNFVSAGYILLSSICIFGQDLMVLMGINTTTGNLFFTPDFHTTKPLLYSFFFVPQAWSLGIELLFYVVAPYSLKRGFVPVILALIFSFFLRIVLYFNFGLHNDPWGYRFFPTEILFFLLGYLSYRFYVFIRNYSIPKYISLTLLYFGLTVTVCYEYIPTTSISFMQFSFRAMCYFFMIVFSLPFIFYHLKKDKLDRSIGELSYPIYISHIFVASLCRVISPDYLSSGSAIALATIGFSLLVVRYIAVPIENYRQKRVRNR